MASPNLNRPLPPPRPLMTPPSLSTPPLAPPPRLELPPSIPLSTSMNSNNSSGQIPSLPKPIAQTGNVGNIPPPLSGSMPPPISGNIPPPLPLAPAPSYPLPSTSYPFPRTMTSQDVSNQNTQRKKTVASHGIYIMLIINYCYALLYFKYFQFIN